MNQYNDFLPEDDRMDSADRKIKELYPALSRTLLEYYIRQHMHNGKADKEILGEEEPGRTTSADQGTGERSDQGTEDTRKPKP